MHEELEHQSQLNFLTMPSLTFFSNSRLVIYDYLPTTEAMRVPATVAPLVQQWVPVRCNPIHPNRRAYVGNGQLSWSIAAHIEDLLGSLS